MSMKTTQQDYETTLAQLEAEFIRLGALRQYNLLRLEGYRDDPFTSSLHNSDYIPLENETEILADKLEQLGTEISLLRKAALEMGNREEVNLLANENFNQSDDMILAAKQAILSEGRTISKYGYTHLIEIMTPFHVLSVGLALVEQGHHLACNVEEAIAELLETKGINL